MRIRILSNRFASLAIGVAVLGAAVVAQRPSRLPEVTPTKHFEEGVADLPTPPRSVLNEIGIGGLPPLEQADYGVPQPNSPESYPVDPAKTQNLVGQFRFFENRDMRPSGAGLLHPGEPSVADNRGVLFGTGNTYGTLSRNNGRTWTRVNPYTRFPASDGGVCCDQRVLYVPRFDMTIWFIQYRYSATTLTGGFRIAVARSRADLKAGRWFSYYWNTRAFGNLANGGVRQWFDFPDIAFSRDKLYVATNVFNNASSYTNSAIIRMNLAGLDGTGSVGAVYYLSSGGPGAMGRASYRFTQTYNGNPPSTMFWASHNNTGSIRIFQWNDSATARQSDVNRNVSAWTSSRGSSPGPDGRDWLGRDDHRIASGYYTNSSEAGFLWSSNARSGRPQSFVRVCRFNPANRNIIANNDVWSTSTDFAYPAVGVNSRGEKGVVMSAGSSTRHVTTFAFLVDNYRANWAGQQLFSTGTGTNGSPSNRWGDYHSVVANRNRTQTFNGTAMRMSGGTATSRTVHQSVWFGRDDYTPTRVALNVRSSGITSGVPITVRDVDLTGRANGSTPFTRTYYQNQCYTLTAPTTRTSGSNVYVFRSWSGTASSSSRTLDVTSIGSAADTVTANYTLARRLSVSSNGNPTITTSVRDVLGRISTRAPGTLYYLSGTPTLTAPATTVIGGRTRTFYRWEYNRVPQPIGRRTLAVSMTANRTARAVYGTNLRGSVTRFGTSCRGTAGTPLHTVSGVPGVGVNMVYRASSLPAGAPTFLVIGGSNTIWSGIRLPLSLAFIGAPGCSAYVSQDAVLPMPNLIGSTSLTLRLPTNSSVIGQSVYSQVIVADRGANQLGFTLTNGNRIFIGGWQIP